MVSRSAALILLAIFTFFPLRAFDSCIHIDTKRAKTIPGWQDLQKFFYPELAIETEAKLKQQGIEIPLTGFSILSEGDAFELHLEGLTEKQLDFLLQQKMISPSRTVQKENGIYTITGENDEKLTIRTTENGLRFSSGTIKAKTLLNFKKQRTALLQGVLLCHGTLEQHPALSDVSIIYFYLNKNADKFVVDLYISGKNAQANTQIRKDLKAYFAKIYANAAKQMMIDVNFFNIYRISEEQGWVKLQITLTPEQAKEFFGQFGNAMKDMLPRH